MRNNPINPIFMSNIMCQRVLDFEGLCIAIRENPRHNFKLAQQPIVASEEAVSPGERRARIDKFTEPDAKTPWDRLRVYRATCLEVMRN